ncbi:MAG TPA: xylose isomerase, partial [Planctomycetota bacterium]|nr:xylose isomerase [Planctomycetota bacterium]
MPAFPDVKRIHFEGTDSRNPLAFRYYDADELVEGKTMRDHLRFSVVYWHTFRGTGNDPFGPGTAIRPWEARHDSVVNAKNRARVAFELMGKLGVGYYAFHDRDVAPEGRTLSETNRNLDAVVKVLKKESERTGIKL